MLNISRCFRTISSSEHKQSSIQLVYLVVVWTVLSEFTVWHA